MADSSRAGQFESSGGRPSPGHGLRAVELSVRNEAVAGDGLRGPTLEGAAELAVLLALIDDHSRLLVGWRWGTGEDMIGLEAPGIDGSWRARGDPRGSPSGLGRQVTSARQQGRAHPSNLTMRSSPFAELTGAEAPPLAPQPLADRWPVGSARGGSVARFRRARRSPIHRAMASSSSASWQRIIV